MAAQVQQTTELADLKKVHDEELQQVKQSKAEQEQRLEEMQQQISKLNLEQQENLNKHEREKESLNTTAAAAKEAAVKVLPSYQHALIGHQVTTESLQNSHAAI